MNTRTRVQITERPPSGAVFESVDFTRPSASPAAESRICEPRGRCVWNQRVRYGCVEHRVRRQCDRARRDTVRRGDSVRALSLPRLTALWRHGFFAVHGPLRFRIDEPTERRLAEPPGPAYDPRRLPWMPNLRSRGAGCRRNDGVVVIVDRGGCRTGT